MSRNRFVALAMSAVVSACTGTAPEDERPRLVASPVVTDWEINGSLPADTLALSFDDGPDAHTLDLARFLHDQGIPATFFVTGCRIEGQPASGSPMCEAPSQLPPSVLGELVALGHRIGNHTQHHLDLASNVDDPAVIRAELAATQAVLDPWILDGVKVFRAPYHLWQGVGPVVRQFPELDALTGSWGWDVDGQDFACSQGEPPLLTPEQCGDRYLAGIAARPLHNGIVQLHDRLEWSVGSDYELRLVRYLVSRLRADTTRTYNFVPVGPVTTAAPLARLSLSPPVVQGGSPLTGTVTLAAPAPPGGTWIALWSVAGISAPAGVLVPAGAAGASFAATAIDAGAATRAQLNAAAGGSTLGAGVIVVPAGTDGIWLATPTATAGSPVEALVTIAAAAPPGGTAVPLSSSNAGAAGVPTPVTVPAGETSARFLVTTGPVLTSTAVTVSATIGGASRAAELTITPVAGTENLAPGAAVTASSETPEFEQLARKAVDGCIDGNGGTPGDYRCEWATRGELAGAWIQLAWEPPATVMRVRLYDRPNLVDDVVAGTLEFSDGSAVGVGALASDGRAAAVVDFAARTVSWMRFRVDQASGQNIGLSELQVFGPAAAAASLASVQAAPSPLASGGIATGTVTLTGPAPDGGILVGLSSSAPAVASAPASALVPPGASTAAFPIATGPISSGGTATISASVSGVTRTTTLAVRALSVSVSPATAFGGSSLVTGTVRLSGPVASPTTVALASGSAAATVPAFVTIPAGATSATFAVSTAPVAARTIVAISASHGTTTRSASVTLDPVAVSSLSLKPTTVVGGETSRGTVRLSARAPAGGVTVSLASTSAAASVPATLSIPGGQTQAQFTVTTSRVASRTTASIRATAGGGTDGATLTITR